MQPLSLKQEIHRRKPYKILPPLRLLRNKKACPKGRQATFPSRFLGLAPKGLSLNSVKAALHPINNHGPGPFFKPGARLFIVGMA